MWFYSCHWNAELEIIFKLVCIHFFLRLPRFRCLLILCFPRFLSLVGWTGFTAFNGYMGSAASANGNDIHVIQFFSPQYKCQLDTMIGKCSVTPAQWTWNFGRRLEGQTYWHLIYTRLGGSVSISSILFFPSVSELSKCWSPIDYHIHICQVSPQQ